MSKFSEGRWPFCTLNFKIPPHTPLQKSISSEWYCKCIDLAHGQAIIEKPDWIGGYEDAGECRLDSLVVRTAAYKAKDPGSIPSPNKLFCFPPPAFPKNQIWQKLIPKFDKNQNWQNSRI